MEPTQDDLPPELLWEAPLWDLYVTLQRQWRVGFGGPTALDLSLFYPLITAKGWDLDLSIELLSVIESCFLEEWDESQK